MANYEKLSIKNWALEDRPREKMLKQGLAALSNAELMAILIGSGNRDESAVELSRRILSDFRNGLTELSSASVDKLSNYKGMGNAKSINVLAALELGKRQQFEKKSPSLKINCSNDVFQIMAVEMVNLNHEEFWVLYLNRGNQVIDKVKISQGGIAGTVIDARLILKHAIEKLASALVLVHNHPSGNLSPSNADIEITKKIVAGAGYMDIKVLDHLIIAHKQFTSFADEGLI